MKLMAFQYCVLNTKMRLLNGILATFLTLFLTTNLGFAQQLLSEADFLSAAFPDLEPKREKLWIKADIKENVKAILGHEYGALRIRYWGVGQKTAWILEEIGKEQPITIGIVVAGRKVQSIQILDYRESRGWEVKYPFFTDQFNQVSLTPDLKLSSRIDGISGATLSVRAVTNIARLALYLHGLTPYDAGEETPDTAQTKVAD